MESIREVLDLYKSGHITAEKAVNSVLLDMIEKELEDGDYIIDTDGADNYIEHQECLIETPFFEASLILSASWQTTKTGDGWHLPIETNFRGINISVESLTINGEEIQDNGLLIKAENIVNKHVGIE